MSCEQIQINLMDYGKGRLKGREAIEVRDHLVECVDCRRLLSEDYALDDSLDGVKMESSHRDVWVSVSARTSPSRAGTFARIRSAFDFTRLRYATAAGLAVLLVWAILVSAQFGHHQSATSVDRSLVDVQSVNVKWSDDPIGKQLDAVVNCIDSL